MIPTFLACILLFVLIIYFTMKNPFYQAFIISEAKLKKALEENSRWEKLHHETKTAQRDAEEGVMELAIQHADLEQKLVAALHQLEMFLAGDVIVAEASAKPDPLNDKIVEEKADQCKPAPFLEKSIADIEVNDSEVVGEKKENNYPTFAFSDRTVFFNEQKFQDGDIAIVKWRGQDKPKFEKLLIGESSDGLTKYSFVDCQLEDAWSEVETMQHPNLTDTSL